MTAARRPSFDSSTWRALARAVVLACAMAWPTPALAADAGDEDWPRVALLLDASGSMWAKLEGRTRIEVARSAVRDLVRDWDARVELGLTVYGHRSRRDCSDIETLLPVGPADPDTLVAAVDGVRPVGMTPLASSLEHTARMLGADTRPATVILVSDGNETCGRDPCAVARSLADGGADFTAHVVGFDVTAEERGQLQCIADATGGLFIDAQGASGLSAALRAAFDDIARRAFSPPLWLAASLSPGSAPLREPVDWRIRPIDEQGRLGAPVVEARAPTLGRRLRGGRYRVEASVEGVSASIDVDVDPSVRDARVISLDAAALHATPVDRREATIEDGVAWRVEGPGADAGALLERRAATTRFLLAAGRYRVSGLYEGDRVTRTLVVRPGQILKKRFQFGVGQLALRAVLSEGRAPLQEDMHWRVWNAEGDLVLDERAASVLQGLDTGVYRTEVVHGQARARAEVQVRSGVTVIETLDLDAGRVGVYGALPAPGGPISDPIDWRIRSVTDGTEFRGRRAASEWILPAGRYRVEGRRGDRRGTGEWVVRPGASSVWPVTFRSRGTKAASPAAR